MFQCTVETTTTTSAALQHQQHFNISNKNNIKNYKKGFKRFAVKR
jgi:hypothetical protein